MVDQITVYWMLGVLGIMIAFGVFSFIGFSVAKKRGDGTTDDIPDGEIQPRYRKDGAQTQARAGKE